MADCVATIEIPVYFDEDGFHIADIPAGTPTRRAGSFSGDELGVYTDLGRAIDLHLATARAAEERGCGLRG